MYLGACFLLLLSWLLPVHLLPWTGWHKEVLAFAAAGLVLVAVLRHPRIPQAMELPRLVGWFLLLGGVVMVQGLLGTFTYQGDAIILVCYLLAVVMVIAAGHAQADPVRSATCLAYLLLLAGVLSSVLALAQVLDVWDDASWLIRMRSLRRPGANLGQPNHLATLLLFALASLGYLWNLKRLSSALAVSLGVVLLTALALTESRTAILGLLLLSAWCWLGLRPAGKTRLAMLALLAYFLALVWSWPQLYQAIQLEGSGSIQFNTNPVGRLVVWPQLWQAVLLKPWWGWGLRNVAEAHNAVLDAYPVGEPYTYAHNIVLDLAVGVGLPLTALLVGAVALWFWRRLRAAQDPVSWFAMAMVMNLGLHSLLEYPYSYAYLLLPVMFMVGVLEARWGAGGLWRVPKVVAVAVFTTTSAALLWSAWEYVQIEEDLRVARFEALRIGQTPADYERPTIFMLTQLDTMLKASRIVPAPNMSEQELELARQAAVRFPWTALQNRYALSLALNGQVDEAVRQLKVMRAMHGEKTYAGIKSNWETLAKEKHPQLQGLQLP